MNMQNYLILAVICFIVGLIYFSMTTHPNDKDLSFFQKFIYSVIAALILPLIIMGGLIYLGIGFAGHGG